MQLRADDASLADGLRRHYRAELGLDVEVLEDLSVPYTIPQPDGTEIKGVRFLVVERGQLPQAPLVDHVKRRLMFTN